MNPSSKPFQWITLIAISFTFITSALASLPEPTKTLSFDAVFISNDKLSEIKQAIDSKSEPTYTAFQALLQGIQPEMNREATALSNWYVPGYYNDAEGHQQAKNGLRDDANFAYGFALAFRITGDDAYAVSAIRLLDGWISQTKSMSMKDDSTLSFAYHFPAFIFAADLLRGHSSSWSQDLDARFSSFLKEKALPMTIITSADNNWGNWGLVLSVACATYLKDADRFEQCVERWKFFIDHQIADDGHLPHEVTRSKGRHGIWYSHFCLMPQTIAAEIIRVNGVDLFDYTSPHGRSLQAAFEKLVPWVADPKTFHYWEGDPADLASPNYFSYWELLNNLWPNPVANSLLKAQRPMSASHSTPYLTLTHAKHAD